MDAPSPALMVLVDVRDMLCAQALAVIARAVEPLDAGASLDILYNAEDVKRDLVAWARERGYHVQESTPTRVRMSRR